MKYVRTQIFIQTTFGSPLISPLFASYQFDENTYNLTDSQYMYGSAMKVGVSVNQNDLDSTSEPATYMPAGLWCVPIYYNNQGDVYSSGGNCNSYENGLVDPSP